MSLRLEESRIEAVQVARRPDDRRWLRASATHLILDESGLTDPTRTLGVSRADAGRAAALLLARVDAGILNPDEVEPVARVVTDVLGVDTLATLREIWTAAAHATPDDDAQAMIDLGRRWCDALGVDPDAGTDTATATVAFGEALHAITRPGTVPDRVTRFRAPDGYEVIDEAIAALDGALGLTAPGAARLLVVVSDGIFCPTPRAAAQARVDRLRATGCGVLWLAPRGPVEPLNGATVLPLTDPAATARKIARTATAALRATR